VNLIAGNAIDSPMKQTLQLKLSQHLSLTPQLQQSIRLLQLSTLELNQELELAVAENPLLERLDDPLDFAMRLAPNGGLESGPASSQAGDSGDYSGEQNAPGAAENNASTDYDAPQQLGDANIADDGGNGSEGALDDWGGNDEYASHQSIRQDGGDDESEFRQLACGELSLREHLLAQIGATQCSDRDRALVTLLIDSLSPEGYLEAELEELLELIPAEAEVEVDELRGSLKLLQSFDPVGIGAPNATGSLLLQLYAIRAQLEPNVLKAAQIIISEHLAVLAARDLDKLRLIMRCSDTLIRAAHEAIRRLNPRPAAAFSGEGSRYVTPDVIVKKVKNQWLAQLNSDVVPRLRVNDAYARILRSHRSTGQGLTAQLQEARWLVKNVQQRYDTILRVSQCIVDRQKSFFSHGAVAMRPLVLREIAESVELHESTISRVTTHKFMLTPYGTFELKYFFGSHVATEVGGSASSTAIRALIKQLIHAEDTKQPLSDSSIAEMLSEQGFVVARRTVAKYREALKIQPVALRKAA
jgi:RNA polymerase sigma-54 factor